MSQSVTGSHIRPGTHPHASYPSTGSSEVRTTDDNAFALFAHKMTEHGLPHQLVALFGAYYDEIVRQHTGLIPDETICPVGSEDLPCISSLERYAERGMQETEHAVVIKLNGGLGTSMGMTYAKSLITVRDGQSFLEIIVRQTRALTQLCGKDVPLALMNSFSTDADTADALRKLDAEDMIPNCFMQHKFPKVDRTTLLPAEYPESRGHEWNPPGHGDLYSALALSGLLDKLLKAGRRYAFISNSDNLGATLDTRILGYIAEEGIPFLMEAAPRTVSDRKGGHLARMPEGGLILRELAQCPSDDLDKFQDIERYGLFNTNNIWVDLKALRNHIRRHGLLKLPIILNPKTVNPRDQHSAKVFQVESAMGAAISCFPGAQAIVTSRDRFLPVKMCSDLLAVMSDCFVMRKDATLIPNPARLLPPIVIDLDKAYYGSIDKLEERFPNGAPKLAACRSLTVQGDVVFGRDIVITGDVVIRNFSALPVRLPSGMHIDHDITIE
ncbi:MAG: UTP--glucose-1-phosphate uridylyltransferase [Halodesulfovibrio sp.]